MANEFVPAGLSAPGGNAAPVTVIPAGTQNAAGSALTAGTTITTNLLNAGMPIQEVKAILGHDKIDTTMEYIYIDEQNVATSYRKYA